MDGLPVVLLCNAETKKGVRCTRPVGPNGLQCWRHDPATKDDALEASNAGAAKRDEAILVELRRQVARNPEAVVTPLLDALEATKSYVTNGELVTVPDHATRIKAFETISDRLLGKPTQTNEITGADGGPLIALLKAAAAREDS
jgi:hypothetical protein